MLLSSPGFVSNAKAAATTSLDRQSKDAQKTVVQQRLDGNVVDEAQARRDFARLVPGGALQVAITSPVQGTTVAAPGTVSIRVAGANSSFVEPTLGAPRRLTITLNGADYPYLPADWAFDGSGIVFNAQIVAVPALPPTARPVTETSSATTTPLPFTAEVNADGTVAFRMTADSGCPSPWRDGDIPVAGIDLDGDGPVRIQPDALIVDGATFFGSREELARAFRYAGDVLTGLLPARPER